MWIIFNKKYPSTTQKCDTWALFANGFWYDKEKWQKAADTIDT